MTARRWWRQLPESAVDRRVRADLSTETMVELRGQRLSAHEIGKRLGSTSSAVRWRPRTDQRVSDHVGVPKGDRTREGDAEGGEDEGGPDE